jgi:PKD repeat protein
MRQYLLFLTIILIALLTTPCKKGTYTAAEGDTIQVKLSSTQVNPGGTVTITVTGIQSNGHPMPDNTIVQLTADFGRITNLVNESVEAVVLLSGKAQALYEAPSDETGGTAKLTVTAGTAKITPESLVISIRNLDVNSLVISADKTELDPLGGSSEITITAYDTELTPVPNKQITFTTTAGNFNPSSPKTTDSSGQVVTTLTTNAAATVTATYKDITKTLDITLGTNLPPTADFEFSPQNPVNGETVYFYSTSIDTDGSIETYFWDFGDGTTSNAKSPSHTFPNVQEQKEFKVIHKVTDDKGAEAVVAKSVIVSLKAGPVADFTYYIIDNSMTSNGTVTVQFTQQVTAGDATITEYNWNFGDGSTAGPAAQSPQHTYKISTPTTFNVQLTVLDANDLTSSVTKAVALGNSENKPPVAAFTYEPQEPEVNDKVQFISQSTDEDGTIDAYNWTIDNKTYTSANPSHTFTSAGVYAVALSVTDNDGASADISQSVTVLAPNQLPTANFTFSPTNPQSEQSIQFNGSASSDSDGTISLYSWDFGDGQTGEGISVNHKYTVTVTTTFTVTLTVTDDRGGQGMIYRNVIVTPIP